MIVSRIRFGTLLLQPSTRAVLVRGFLASAQSERNMKQSPRTNFYKLLGLHKTASLKQIKDAYYELAKQYHPDTTLGGKEVQIKFQEITEAYEVLSDETKKAEYDKTGDVQNVSSSQSKILNNAMQRSDYVLRNIFKNSNVRRSAINLESSDPDAILKSEMPIQISFEESITGGRRDLDIPVKVRCEKCREKGIFATDKSDVCHVCGGKGVQIIKAGDSVVEVPCKFCGGSKVQFRVPCPECDGKGHVVLQKKIVLHIPPLVEDGDTLEVRHPVRNKAITVRFKVDQNSKIQRQQNNILSVVNLPLSTAILGGKINVKTLSGFVKVDVRPGTQPGERLKLAGRGVKCAKSKAQGDHIVEFKVLIPGRLNEKQKAMVRQLQQIEHELEAQAQKEAHEEKARRRQEVNRNKKQLFPNLK